MVPRLFQTSIGLLLVCIPASGCDGMWISSGEVCTKRQGEWYLDEDGDGVPLENSRVEACVAPSTDHVELTEYTGPFDCDDGNVVITERVWYQDLDGDGWGNGDEVIEACEAPLGHVDQAGDCKDDDAAVNVSPVDLDGDGFTTCDDCDDNNSTINPSTIWYLDGDGDGVGVDDSFVQSCESPPNTSFESGDCVDDNAHFSQWCPWKSVDVGFNACGIRTDNSIACWGGSGQGEMEVLLTQMDFSEISLGTCYGCGLREDGRIMCWRADGCSSLADLIPPDVDDFTAVSNSSFAQACGLRESGQILCWGTASIPPSLPPSLSNFVAVSAGMHHVCGLQDTGRILCWGVEYGEPIHADFIEVSAGREHTCGLRTGGQIECWGRNTSNQASPPAHSDFVAVSTGWDHSCALRDNGTIECWGNNTYGRATPPQLGDFVQVSAGYDATCGLRKQGQMACWGHPERRRFPGVGVRALGAGGAYTCDIRSGGIECWGEAPIDLMNVVQATSNGRTCAIHTDGRLACWGYQSKSDFFPPDSDFVQVDGYLDAEDDPDLVCGLHETGEITCWHGDERTRENPSSNDDFSDVSVGRDHACGLRGSAIECWGSNDQGQIGPIPAGRFIDVDAGRLHTCAVSETGEVLCWGSSFGGQSNPAITQGFISVEAGSNHTCGLLEDGRIECWGSIPDPPTSSDFIDLSSGSAISCGLRSTGQVLCWGAGVDPLPGLFSQVVAGQPTCGIRYGELSCWGAGSERQGLHYRTDFERLSAGPHHFCGLTAEGVPRCFGLNDYGQSAPPAGIFSRLSIGTWHTCGILNDGSSHVVCWGRGDDGQIQVPFPTYAYTSVAAGRAHSCALRTGEGTVDCWGADERSQLEAPAGGGFTGLTASRDHTCALGDDGSATCWGDNTHGQSELPADLPNRDFIAIGAGPYHTCALQRDEGICGELSDCGAVRCWGRDSAGQVSNAPALGFTEIAAGEDHTCGIKPDGAVRCWGSDLSGQSSPVVQME